MRRITLFAICVWAVSLPAVAGDLRLEIRDGKVTLIAHDVPARQILSEWARIGRTQVINLDKLPVANLTLQLEGVPESKALDLVLRNASGYLAAPRTDAVTDGSVFGIISIMPPSTAVAASTAPRPLPTGMNPPVQTFRPGGFPMGDTVDDQDPPVATPQGQPGVNMSPLTPGMPGYVPPPTMAPPGAIPPYPGAPINIPNAQPQNAQPTPQNPWGVTVPGSTAPGVISPVPQPGVPTPPGMANPLIPKRPGGGQ